MKSVVVLAAAAGLVSCVAAHVHQHEHLHRRSTTAAPSGTPCPQWTGGHRPPAYLTNLPLSVQTELPKWTGAPPPDWCSQTAWMESYVSCATVYASCNAKTTTTSSSTTSSNATTTGTTTPTTTPTGTSNSTSTWATWSDSSSTAADPATTSTTSSTSTWGSWTDSSTTTADPATTSTTSTWGSWTDSSTTTADPATTSTTSTWGSWTDPSSTSADPATTSTTSTWESWADPSSTSAAPTSTSSTSFTGWGSWVDPASTSTSSSSSATTFTGWGSWVDPASSSTPKAAVGTSTSSTAWGTWADPASSSTTKAAVSNSTSSTTWGTWADPASSSVCGCTTVIVTVTGDPTWAPDSATTTSVTTTTYTTVTVVPTKSASSSSSSTTTTWGSWDPTTSSSSSSTSWGSWADGSSSSPASSTTFSTSWSTTTGSSKAVSSGGSGNAAISPAGSLWAITYSPYTAGGDCKDAGSVTADITAIKALGFTTVRIYSTDCSGLENIGTAARAVGLKLILGVFIKSSGVSGAQPQVSEIVAWGQWDLVELVVIGNEALFNQYLSVSDLAGFISSSKWAFSDAGYTGPVTTTEPLNIWQEEGASLCGAIDVVAANIHAFFNPQTSADQAGAFIESELTILDTICPGKSTYVVESGWPHAGEANGAAVPGVAEQATALASIQSTCGSQVVFFTFEDDLWKAPGAFDVEQSWGCASAF